MWWARYYVRGTRYEQSTQTGDESEARRRLAKIGRDITEGTWSPPDHRRRGDAVLALFEETSTAPREVCLESTAVRMGPCVYVVRPAVAFEDIAGLVKIGRTRDLLDRFSMLQGGSPVQLALETVVWTACAARVEALAHLLAAPARLHGEWFRLSREEVFELIGRLQRKACA